MAIRDIKALISVMPTIDAIPVEWLRKVMMDDVMDESGSDAASRIIELWRKEQGRRDSGRTMETL